MNKIRVIKTIDLLLKCDPEEFITIDNISSQLQVSNKTIRNDLPDVEKLLKHNNLSLLKKTGAGIKIDGKLNDRLHLMDNLHHEQSSHQEFSPEARKLYIAQQLLSYENCRVYELNQQLFVSRATIHKDLISLAEDLSWFKTTLVRKNNSGVSISGNERNLRNLMFYTMQKDSGCQTFIRIVQDPDYKCDGTFVFAGLETTDDELKDFIQCMLNSKNRFFTNLSFRSLIFILLRIFIVYLRTVDHHTISTDDETFLPELIGKPYYNEAREICDRIANHYRIQVPKLEIRYLQIYFLALQSENSLTEDERIYIDSISDDLIDSWSNQLNLPFKTDEKLNYAIRKHMYSLMTRLEYSIPNENPLLMEILELYHNTFQIVSNSMTIPKLVKYNVNDDEIGFITLHLAASLERMKQPLNTLVVSHNGRGCRDLLKEKLSARIPEIRIVAQENFSSFEMADLSHIDIILSTKPLAIKADIPVLIIDSLLHEYDISALSKIVLEYYKKKNTPLNMN